MKKFLKDESGATAIEYTLIAAAIGGMLVVAIPRLVENIEFQLIVVTDAIGSADIHAVR